MFRSTALVVAAVVAAGGGAAAISRATDSTPSQPPAGAAEQQGLALQSAFVKAVASVSPSVVQIEDRSGLGSGIVLDRAGHIVTNNHVVTGAKAFTVTTRDGKRYRAEAGRLISARRPGGGQGLGCRSQAGVLPPIRPSFGSAISRSRSATRSGCGRA